MLRRHRFVPVIFGAALAIGLLSAPAHANTITITAHTLMDGMTEVPPVNTPATGEATITIVGDILTVDEDWSGLIGGNAGAAHIHCCSDPGTNVGVAVGFPGFPAAASGSYFHVFDLTDPAIYTAAFRNGFGGGTAAGAEAALIEGILAGRAYVNIHNTQFGGGEIRGQLVGQIVPEPATLTLFGLGLAGAAIRRRIRH